jgi:hypothetical protein
MRNLYESETGLVTVTFDPIIEGSALRESHEPLDATSAAAEYEARLHGSFSEQIDVARAVISDELGPDVLKPDTMFRVGYFAQARSITGEGNFLRAALGDELTTRSLDLLTAFARATPRGELECEPELSTSTFGQASFPVAAVLTGYMWRRGQPMTIRNPGYGISDRNEHTLF